MSIDALVYTTIQNNITDPNTLSGLSNTVYPPGNVGNTVAGVSNYLTSILHDTTIKRACCLGQAGNGSTNGVNVRIPIPTGYNITQDVDAPIRQQFGYIDKRIQVPSSMCSKYPDYTPGSPSCNNFYDTYCQNMLYFYNTENGNKFNQSQWVDYKKECACYGPVTPTLAQFAPLCYMGGCNIGSDIYLDPMSRAVTGGVCPTTICNSVVNVNNVQAGQGVNLNTNLQQNCGQNSPTTGSSAVPPSTGSNNSGLNSGSGSSGLNSSGLNSGLNSGSGNSGLNSGSGNSGLNNGSGSSGLNSGSGNSGLNNGSGNSGLNSGSGNSGLNSGSGSSGLNSGSGNSGLNSGSGSSGLNSGSGNSGLNSGSGIGSKPIIPSSDFKSGYTAPILSNSSETTGASYTNLFGSSDYYIGIWVPILILFCFICFICLCFMILKKK
jgi:hypothetical protein